VQFTGIFALKASSVTNKTPNTKSLPPCFAVFAEFHLAGVSARSPVNLPVLSLALSASRRLLTVYSSSHLVRPVLRRLCADEACSASEAVSSFPISDPGADGAGSSSLLTESGCSTRRRRDSSDARVAAARRSVILLPFFSCSPSRVGQFSKKEIDF